MIRLLLLLLLAVPAWAAESPPVRSARMVATLVSDTDAVAPGVPMRLGLRLRMAPGWHTYWRNPGEAGAPPELTITGAAAGPIAWPTPERQREGPVMTYGYHGEVTLPVTITPDGPLHVVAQASWLVCETICVPEEGSFTLDLPQGSPGSSAEAPLFAATDARMPRPSPFAARMGADGVLVLEGVSGVRDAWVFPDEPGVIEAAAAQAVSVRDGSVQIALSPTADFQPDRPFGGTVVLRDQAGQERFLQIAAAPVPAGSGTAQALGSALLGGLLLNLMPCVFPILAMKAMAVARLGGAARATVRAEAGFYTLGVMLAFAGLGGALLLARAAGGALGWGFQLQSPVVVTVIAWVLFGVGLNLSGVFAVGGRLAGAGQGWAGRGGAVGSLCTGLLAVVVATPCTAPFMGVALAAAVAAPPAVAIGVFLMMGLGLAAPYAVLAVAPGLARLLPRPGAWMDVLRGALAFPMYGAAAWLVWVVGQQAGPDGVLIVLAGGVLLGFAAWCWNLGQRSGEARWSRAAAIAGLCGAVLLLFAIAPAPPAQAAGSEAFSPARLERLRAEGRPVFVNMTASWCVTCLWNERLALSPAAVREGFAAKNVAYLKGDWTRADPAITAYLRAHARDGVPLYVYYKPGQEGQVLPQILTAGLVLGVL